MGNRRRRYSGILPSVRNNAVRDLLHRPEFLVDVCDGRGVAVEDGGAVVVGVVVGR